MSHLSLQPHQTFRSTVSSAVDSAHASPRGSITRELPWPSAIELPTHSRTTTADSLPNASTLLPNTPWPDMPLTPALPSSAELLLPGPESDTDWLSVDVASSSYAGGASTPQQEDPLVRLWGRGDSAYSTPVQRARGRDRSGGGKAAAASMESHLEVEAGPVAAGGGSAPEPRPLEHDLERGRERGSGELLPPLQHGPWGWVKHCALLPFAEHPIRKHRQWAGRIERTPDEAKGSGLADIIRCLNQDFSSESPSMGGVRQPDRFVPLERLEEQYARDYKRRRLVYALRRKQAHSYTGIFDRLANEVFIMGELSFDKCTPAKLKGHFLWFTTLFVMVNLITFAFMAGEYGAWLGYGPEKECSPQFYGNGPHGLWRWMVDWQECRAFSRTFLIMWGARYAPNMQGSADGYRWVTSLLIHRDFLALLANLLLLACLAGHLERRYGTRRALFLAALSGIGGNFFGAATEGVCSVELAGSAVAFGFLGPFAADLALNFERIRFPALRILVAAICCGLWIAVAVMDAPPGRLATLGGFLCGLLPGTLFLPHIKSEKYEWFLPFGAAFAVLGFFLVLPLYMYLVRLKEAMTC